MNSCSDETLKFLNYSKLNCKKNRVSSSNTNAEVQSDLLCTVDQIPDFRRLNWGNQNMKIHHRMLQEINHFVLHLFSHLPGSSSCATCSSSTWIFVLTTFSLIGWTINIVNVKFTSTFNCNTETMRRRSTC